MVSTNGQPAKHSKVKIALSVIALCVASLILVRYLRASNVGGEGLQLWYYDLNSRKLIRTGGKLAPTQAANGTEVVRAYVFSCGECSDSAKRFVGWLEQFSDGAKTALQSKMRISTYLGPNSMESVDDDDISSLLPPGSRQIRQAEDGSWLDFYSAEAIHIRDQARSKCGGEIAATSCDQTDFVP